MWSLAGDELTGTYGRWSGRSYELRNDAGDTVAIVMSSDAEPSQGWCRVDPDEFWAEGCRWELRVPAAQVTGARSVLVETPISGKVFTVRAQREDGCWALTRTGALEPGLASRLGLEEKGGTWAGWVSRDEVTDFIRTPSAETHTPV